MPTEVIVSHPEFHVFVTDGLQFHAPADSADYEFVLWRPSLRRWKPPMCQWKQLLYATAHHLRVFRNRDWSVLFIRQGDRIVHYSGIVPACFRWPFMNSDDLQISGTWTDPTFRGRGLATAALRKAITLFRRPERQFWYLTRTANAPSIAVCRKAGFSFVGTAHRTARFHSRLLGRFLLETNTTFDRESRRIA